MMPTLSVQLIVYGLAVLIVSCQKEPGHETNPQSDTRIRVQEAYAKMDHMQVTYAFNDRRAALIKAKMEQESDPAKRLNIYLEYAHEVLKQGKTKEAIQMFADINRIITNSQIPMTPEMRQYLYSLIGIAFMRHGEIENCLQHHNHESCFLPIQGEGVHQLTFGSQNAIKVYASCLAEFPNDLETRYLYNLAHMTLGRYPEGVPEKFRIDPAWFTNTYSFPRFEEIAAPLGLNTLSLAGGAIVDDFTNDGWLDIVVSSWSHKEGLTFFMNNGDGSFSDQTRAYGLEGHVGALNINQTDFNNDGWLDLYLMRGGWYMDQGEIPNTLLMNTGKGSFVDVTLQAGLTKHTPTQTSAWADFNLDGWLDLVIANETLPNGAKKYGIDLYLNQQDGTFKYHSAKSGLLKDSFFKGCVAADINNDLYPDIYLSALSSLNPLFINQGQSGPATFKEADPSVGVGDPVRSFPCWNFDVNNDGWEDLFVSAYAVDGTPATLWMESHLGKPDVQMLPKLYLNKGDMRFEEVGQQMGLNEVIFAMGCNFGDINVDGFLDFYVGTGNPAFQSIVPNKMYLNIDGKRFEDVSYVGGFANVQKGHGVGFGDLDHDGDEDIFVEIGGAYDGDGFYNCLFENPNHEKNNWVILKMEGTTANRPAIGARVSLFVEEAGQERMIARTVTSGASFGGNSLDLEVGLRKATKINKVVVHWPCAGCEPETFTNLEINKAYELVQEAGKPRSLPYQQVLFQKDGHAGHHH